MGFPFEEASWDAVSGAMYMGSTGSAPAIFTVLAIAACVAVLFFGNRSEHNRYKD